MSKHTCNPMSSWKIAEKHEASLRKRLRRAHTKNARKLADELTREYLSSFDCRLIATREAIQRMPVKNRPCRAKIPEIAMTADPWIGTDETVRVSFKPKASNPSEFRPIMDFGPVNRTLQALVHSVLAARSDLLDCQFALKGQPAAIGMASKALVSGQEYAIEIDIRNCYPSFKGEAVPGLLPLPKEVTRRVILSRYLNLSLNEGNLKDMFATSKDDGEPPLDEVFPDKLAEARQGIPQGASTSPLSVEIMLAPVLKQLLPWVTVVNYADNILVMGGDENDVASTVDILRGALKAHPAGPFLAKKPKCYRPGDPIQFLGCELRKESAGVHIAPSMKNLGAFTTEFSHRLKLAHRENISQAARQKAFTDWKRYTNAWWESFRMCTDAKAHRAAYLSRVSKSAAEFGISI